MNPRVKKMWLKALRRRKLPYRQGVEALRNGGEFCCLGVLCDLHLADTGEGKWEADYYIPSGEEEAGDDKILPKAVKDWAGLMSVNPRVDVDGVATCLGEVNDGTNVSQPQNFRQIANIIERQL